MMVGSNNVGINSSGYSTTIIWRAFSALTIFPKSVNEEEVDVLLLANVYIQTKHGR